MSGSRADEDDVTSEDANARFETGADSGMLEELAEVIMYEITSLTRTDLPCASVLNATWTWGMLSGFG